jgi:hypothetical protein
MLNGPKFHFVISLVLLVIWVNICATTSLVMDRIMGKSEITPTSLPPIRTTRVASLPEPLPPNTQAILPIYTPGQSPVPSLITSTDGAERQANTLEEIAGIWLEVYPGGSAQLEIGTDGVTIFTVLSGSNQGYQDRSISWFEDKLLKVKAKDNDATGVYRVFVTHQDGRAVQIRYELVEDRFQARSKSMTYAPLTLIESAQVSPTLRIITPTRTKTPTMEKTSTPMDTPTDKYTPTRTKTFGPSPTPVRVDPDHCEKTRAKERQQVIAMGYLVVPSGTYFSNVETYEIWIQSYQIGSGTRMIVLIQAGDKPNSLGFLSGKPLIKDNTGTIIPWLSYNGRDVYVTDWFVWVSGSWLGNCSFQIEKITRPFGGN